ncbi:restriction endonuclease [Alteromonas sp. MB-3u-76]|uniref:restriction endonuclease subunit S n=1 Tax=Alteromonas sp. MB-3u-76 TaxID=2058133 RepID=UPI000C318E16|nr:restriction endonuclease subunit S [Alteromonas sp. MB-3u-76]AUC89534.1 restriction endonuclease [Alteromonas sp. MB-3u-76]
MSWPLVKLGNCAEVVSGGTPKRDESAYWDGDIYWVTPKDLSKRSDIYLSKTPEKITELGLRKSSANLLPVGTVLFSSRAPIGHVAITKTEMCSNQGFKSLVPKEGLDSLYLYFCLKFYKTAIENLGNGATFKEVSKKVVENFEIPLPPLPIQKQIAAVLEKADNLRKQSQQMEQELNSLAQSVFLDMFGDPVKNTKSWPKSYFKDVSKKLTVGVVVKPASYYVNSGVPALRSLNIKNGEISTDKLVFFSNEVNDTVLSKSKLRQRDIVIVRSGQPGKAAVVPPQLDGCNAIDILICRVDETIILSEYVTFFLNSEGGRILVLANEKGQIQKHLNVGELGKCSIPVPPIHLQLEFVNRLRAIKLQLDTASKNVIRINELFNSLIQRAFKGELDLKDVA